MTNRTKLHKELDKMIIEIEAMKQYLGRQNYFGTIEQMMFSMHERITKAHSTMLAAQEDQIRKEKK